MSACYKVGSEPEDAMAVVASWIGKNEHIRVVYHGGTAVCADCQNGVIHIPHIACSSGITHDALMMLRGRVYHEAGHIAETKDVKSKDKVLGEIANALEDCRIEAILSRKYDGCRSVLRWNSERNNMEIASKISSGVVVAPLWEALVAMIFQSNSISPAWTLTPKAKKYFDLAYSTFIEWMSCKSYKDVLDLAKRIKELIKDEIKEEKANKPKKSKKSEKSEPESGDSPEESESSSGESKEDGDKSDTESESDSDEESDSEEDEGEKDEGEKDEGEKDEGEKDEGEKDEGSDNGDSESEEDASRSSKGLSPDEEAEAEMEKDVENGMKMEDVLKDQIEKAIEDAAIASDFYTALRDQDEHVVVKIGDDFQNEYKNTLASASASVSAMTRCLEQALRSMSKCRKASYQRSGKIDHSRLVAIAKSLSREVFYRKHDGEDIDVAVEICIDESYSMRSSHRETALLAMVVGEALNAMGIPFEVTGSTTTGYIRSNTPFTRTNPIRYYHYKTFGENWGVVRSRLIALRKFFGEEHNNNIDGEVVEYAAMRLVSRPESRKVVFSLSDGVPESGQGDCADEKMRKNIITVCSNARKNGIEVYAFGIDTTAPEKYYGKDFFVYMKPGSFDNTFVTRFVNIITKGKVKV